MIQDLIVGIVIREMEVFLGHLQVIVLLVRKENLTLYL